MNHWLIRIEEYGSVDRQCPCTDAIGVEDHFRNENGIECIGIERICWGTCGFCDETTTGCLHF